LPHEQSRNYLIAQAEYQQDATSSPTAATSYRAQTPARNYCTTTTHPQVSIHTPNNHSKKTKKKTHPRSHRPIPNSPNRRPMHQAMRTPPRLPFPIIEASGAPTAISSIPHVGGRSRHGTETSESFFPFTSFASAHSGGFIALVAVSRLLGWHSACHISRT